ncbi:MAG: hypothetical protein ACFFG0_08290 [Candidatus Thorarchaeota archaeon]
MDDYIGSVKESFIGYPPVEGELDEFEFTVFKDSVTITKNGVVYKIIPLEYETDGFRFRFLNETDHEIQIQ